MTTHPQETTDVASQSRRRIVGTFNPGLLVFAACMNVAAFVVAWGVLPPPPSDAGVLWNVLPAACLLVTAESLLATSRIVVDPTGFIDVIGPVIRRRIPVSELLAIESDDGLRFRLVSGRRIGSIAYGSSLLGRAMRYRRSAKAARRIQAAIGKLPAGDEPALTRPDSVTWQLRTRGLLAILSVNCVLVLGTIALHLVETAQG